MRNPWPLLSCLAVLVPAALPALAQPRPAAQTVSPGLPPESAEKSSIGFVDLPQTECRPVYAPGDQQVGPPMAEAEQRTQGLVVVSQACGTRR